MARVVLVSEKGERLLDTLVKPQTEEVAIKSGIKTQLFKLSKEKGAPIEIVREYVVHLISGKQVIGYHLPQKMADFGLLDLIVSKEGVGSATKVKRAWGECFDVAKIFNANNAAQ